MKAITLISHSVFGWLTRYQGVRGAVMACLTHGGLAAPEAYQDATTNAPCIDWHLPYAKTALARLRSNAERERDQDNA